MIHDTSKKWDCDIESGAGERRDQGLLLEWRAGREEANLTGGQVLEHCNLGLKMVNYQYL